MRARYTEMGKGPVEVSRRSCAAGPLLAHVHFELGYGAASARFSLSMFRLHDHVRRRTTLHKPQSRFDTNDDDLACSQSIRLHTSPGNISIRLQRPTFRRERVAPRRLSHAAATNGSCHAAESLTVVYPLPRRQTGRATPPGRSRGGGRRARQSSHGRARSTQRPTPAADSSGRRR